jgi:uncharacterized protein involved in propanediol utilization
MPSSPTAELASITPGRGAIGVSSAFGTFGELLQGVLPEPDGDFLVTLPIAQWTTASFQLVRGSSSVDVSPPHKRKALRLAEMMLHWADVPYGGVLILQSSLPEGKGLASSSADLVATARAVGNALGRTLLPETIEAFLGRIEPTDGVLYSGIVEFDHRKVQLRRYLGSIPSMVVVGVDEGGAVDTIEFNRIAKPFSSADRREYARLLEQLTAAVAARDLAAVGTVATRSAQLNQMLWRKRLLDPLSSICADVGALGVVAAHSGTMLGVLLDIGDPAYRDRIAATVRACSSLGAEVSLYRTLSFD